MRIALAIACCLSAVAPASAAAVTETSSAGAATATLTYDRTDDGIKNTRITVHRDGTRLVDSPGPRFPRCSERCEYSPLNAFVREKSIFVRNLDADSEPEVLGEFYTGGANCCSVSRIYDFDPAGGLYRQIDRNWNTGNHRGPRDLDRDGAAEFLSTDARFEFRFGCGACTPEPVRVFRLRAGRFADVTRRFRAQIRSDLRENLRSFRRARRDRFAARGVLAAVVADRYLLGEGKRARRTLRSALRKGYLRGARGDGIPDGRAYIRALLRFLRRTGYRG